jgi:hypothetical protein
MKGEIKKYGFIFNQEGTVRNKRYATVIVDDRKLADFIVYAPTLY